MQREVGVCVELSVAVGTQKDLRLGVGDEVGLGADLMCDHLIPKLNNVHSKCDRGAR